MSNSELNPFSKASACSTCPSNQYATTTQLNDDLSCGCAGVTAGTCTACNSAHASGCTSVTCNTGHGNIDNDASNGCEVSCAKGYEGDHCETAILCSANQKVVANACVDCPAGTHNGAGDSAASSNTICDDFLLFNQVNLKDKANLDSVVSVAMSPEGTHLYAVSGKTNRIVHWDRNSTTGALSNQVNGAKDDANLYGVTNVIVSGDGLSVYAVSNNRDSLVSWTRNPSSGALTNQVNLIDTVNLNQVRDLVLSPDGKNLYAVVWATKSIVTWDRDTSTGALTNQVQAKSLVHLNGVYGVAVSPDGKHVYAATVHSHGVTYWERNPTTGALTNMEGINDETNMDGACSVAVSADGNNVYVVSMNSKSLVYFKRHWPLTLAFDHLTDQVNIVDTTLFNNVKDVVVTPDDRRVLVVAGNSIALWLRDPSDGSLSARSSLTDATNLAGAFSIAVSPDTKNVYVAAFTFDGIVHWDVPCNHGEYNKDRVCTTCGNGGASYQCESVFYKTGPPCNGEGTEDTQTCQRCGNTNDNGSNGGEAYICQAGSFKSGEKCGGDGSSDTQTCLVCSLGASWATAGCPSGYYKKGSACDGTGTANSQGTML